MKRILVVTDAWTPQVNGVVRTLQATIAVLRSRGHVVDVITPDQFPNMPMPGYPEIRLALPLGLRQRLDGAYDAVHIATEGPLGLVARMHLAGKRAFTTAFHTQFAAYAREHYKMPQRLSWAFLRWFHSRSKAVLVPTRSMADELEGRCFHNVVVWGRGVDESLFRRERCCADDIHNLSDRDHPRPYWLNVGRVSVEKNLDAFLSLDLPGTKFVVGDGPDLARLRAAHPGVVFVGKRSGKALAASYRDADVFVFPSRTDTFGLVNIEAISCGTPVAAYPVTGPKDIVVEGVTGSLDADLRAACLRALTIDRSDVVGSFSWERATDVFFSNLAFRT